MPTETTTALSAALLAVAAAGAAAMTTDVSSAGGEACRAAAASFAKVNPAETVDSLPAPRPAERQTVDLAICLDTSGSMSGLIESAKQKLWAIVNDLALAEPAPALRVALLTYGNDGHPSENGWVHLDCPFTTDLDTVSEQLFALSTNGGTEYVGRVMQCAVSWLDWSPSDDGLKLIVVAGNESADQDQTAPYREMCRDAIQRGIMINAVYCGSAEDAIAPGWREIASLADGHFASIDHNQGTIVVATPYDQQLAALSADLNETYLPFGEQGEFASQNQKRQDDNAESLNAAAAAERCQTKAGAIYDNARWDLVDAVKQEDFDLEAVPVDQLPEAMQTMTAEQREVLVQKTAQRRTALQVRVQDLSQQRKAFISEQMREQGLDESAAFDAAVRRAIRNQAAIKGIQFPGASEQQLGGQGEPEDADRPNAAPAQTAAMDEDGC